MQVLLDFCKNEYFLLVIGIINILLLIIFFINTISVNKAKGIYKTLIKKLGNSNNIEEMLHQYTDRVQRVEENNKEIKANYKYLEEQINKSIKKVGIVRYSAFRDMGSDLSFALALLDNNNNGIVLNGIYSVENSNIYAKPIENGKSKYSISEEEKKALDIAIQQ